MKKLIYSMAIIAILGTCVAAKLCIDYTATHKTADVNVFNGVAVFTDSTPVLPYDVLGEVNKHSSGGFGNDSYESKRDGAIKKAKDEYPSMDGILISFKNNGACTATAIKFKQ